MKSALFITLMWVIVAGSIVIGIYLGHNLATRWGLEW